VELGSYEADAATIWLLLYLPLSLNERRDGKEPMARTYRSVPSHWLRHPKTTQERRWVAAAREQGVKVRRFNATHLPSAYEDKPVAAGGGAVRQATAGG
jgi:hypothetical protein